ncbi:helix-turn-helix domain-containing protein [Spirosoma daeguense]
MLKNNDHLLDRKTAARYLGLSPGTLAVWDCTKRHNLNPIKIGRAVRYRKSDLDQFIEQQLWSTRHKASTTPPLKTHR